MAMEPDILLLDEPINGLDERTRATIKRILSDMDLSYILISHEIDFLSQVTDTIYVMENGKILTDQAVQPHQHTHAHPQGTYPHKHD